MVVLCLSRQPPDPATLLGLAGRSGHAHGLGPLDPGYQPSAALRHLVQIRDGTCTFPGCSRHARESDFEHAIPYHQADGVVAGSGWESGGSVRDN
jgi:hypothetical protein